MKKQVQSLSIVSALLLFLSVTVALNAQQTSPQTPPSDSQAEPSTPPDQTQQNQEPSPPPDQAGQRSRNSQDQAAGAQSFMGMIVKSGDKYVFQDAATGNTYDIDHQDEVKKFEGKKVKVHGTLDANGKMIHLQ